MARLEISGLCKGWDFPVIDELSLSVEEGEFFVVVGPSGIGKTTLLRLVAGLETPDAGRVTVGETDVTPVPPYRRRVAMTFESYALYPHMTVAENIASPLRARGEGKGEIDRRVLDVAKLLRIDHLLDRKPAEVSGGQKQRTALGRTLVADPEVFLLDEPISHLDAKIRHELRSQFHTLEDLRRVATLYVTHDYAEALSLGDRIGVMGDGGRLIQIGNPRDVFERPATLRVAENLGQPTINVVPATLSEESGWLLARAAPGVAFPVGTRQREQLRKHRSRNVTLGVRPQHLHPVPAAEAGSAPILGKVDVFEPLGSAGIMIADAGGLRLTALTHPERHFEHSEPVGLSVEHEQIHFFDPETGQNLVEVPQWPT